MKIELCYFYGDPITDDISSKTWKLSIELDRSLIVFSSVPINSIVCGGDAYQEIILSSMPARVDVTSLGHVWIHNTNQAERYPEPYKTLSSETSKTVWDYYKQEVEGVLASCQEER